MIHPPSFMAAAAALLVAAAAMAGAAQVAIPRIEMMPNVPSPLTIPDWRAKALAYDALVFNRNATGTYLPAIWADTTRVNSAQNGFGLPSYIGSTSQTRGAAHEAVTCLGSILGGTYAGIDKRAQDGYNYVLMGQNYYNTRNGQNLVLNNTSTTSGNTFWYEIWPHILFYSLEDRYQGVGSSTSIMFSTANKWYSAAGSMGGNVGVPDFNHTAFNFVTAQPVDNGTWREPDAAAGIAWLQYAAYKHYGSANFLTGAEWGLQYLDNTSANPNYEIMLSYGAYTAARMNAEQGTTHNVEKLVNWVFEPTSAVRSGWGCIVGTWNGYQVNGLLGSTTDGGGYAFAFTTFANAGSLVPMVRYDDRFARAIGKWMLNLSANSRLFYRDQIPAANQSSAGWTSDVGAGIAYEGLRKTWNGTSPYATGDAVRSGWASTDFALYGAGYVGILGGIVSRTNVPEILRLNCLATDVYTGPTYPTAIYYNPTATTQSVEIDFGAESKSLYDAVANRYLLTSVSGVQHFQIPADTAVLAVTAPGGGVEAREGKRLLIDGVVVDFSAGAPVNQSDAWSIY